MMPNTVEAPLFFDGPDDEHTRKVALVVNEILKGKTNNAEPDFTLVPNATQTTIESPRVCCNTVPQLMPKSQSAAAAQAAGVIWYEARNGVITINHDSQPDTDRVFGLVLVG